MTAPAVDFPDLPGAACVDVDPEVFFAIDVVGVNQARMVCRRCPAIHDCLAWALTHTEHGVWAATTEDQRTDLTRRHSRSHQ